MQNFFRQRRISLGPTGPTKTRTYVKDLLPWGIGVLVVVMMIAVGRQALKHYQIQQEIRAAQNNVAELRTKNGELLDLLSYVQSPAYTEEQARLKLGLAKNGERVAVLPEGQVLGVSALDDRASREAQGGVTNHWKWWSYFFPSAQ